MSVRVDTSSLIAGACVLGHRGLGVLGSVIRATTATGTHGPGYLYNDLTGADDLKEIRGLIVAPPSAGTFTAFEDGSFTLVGAPDGSYSFLYRLFADGADLGTATATIDIGYPITGTTPVSRTLDLSWSVLNSGTVTSQLGLSWIVRAGVQQPLALAYPVKAGVQATRPLSWIVRAGVQQALPLVYSVLTSAQRSQALSWAVKAAAQATLPLSWIVRSGVQQPLALGYSVKNSVQADRTLGYPVLTAAQSSLLLDYLVRAGVQVSFPLAYQVTNAVSVDLPLAWVVFSSQGVPELLCVSVESAYQFKHLLEDAFEIMAGFPALRVDVKKVTTVCGDC